MIREGLSLNIIFCLIFVALSLLCYSNALNNAFILDDDFLISNNPYVKDLTLAPKLFGVDIFHFKNRDLSIPNLYYRPLQMLSYSFDYLFFKLNVYGYHLTNVLLHSLNCFVLFLLLGLIFKDKILAFLTSAIFCIHPIQVSVVAYITGRGSILETTFMLLSLFFVVKYFLLEKKAYYAFSLLFFILALFTREWAVLLPIFVAICAFFLQIERKKIFIYVLPFWLIVGAYIVFRLFFMPCSKCTLMNLFSLMKIKDFIFLSQDYLSQLIFPVGLRSLFFGNATLFIKTALIFLAWLITIACLAGAIIFKKKTLVFGLLFYFVGLLPAINLIDHIDYFGVILSEHYLYLSCIGIFFILANALIFLEKRIGISVKVLVAMFFLFYMCLTILNNNYYKEQIVFYRHILSVEKNHSFVRVNLGNAYFQKNMFDQAIKEAQATLSLEPDAWDAYLLLGNAFKGKGQIEQAIKFYRKTIQFNPVGIQGYLNLGITLAEAEDLAGAESVFKDVLIRFPDSIELRWNLGALYGNTGNFKKAILVWQEGLVLDPNDKRLRDNISYANELEKKVY